MIFGDSFFYFVFLWFGCWIFFFSGNEVKASLLCFPLQSLQSHLASKSMDLIKQNVFWAHFVNRNNSGVVWHSLIFVVDSIDGMIGEVITAAIVAFARGSEINLMLWSWTSERVVEIKQTFGSKLFCFFVVQSHKILLLSRFFTRFNTVTSKKSFARRLVDVRRVTRSDRSIDCGQNGFQLLLETRLLLLLLIQTNNNRSSTGGNDSCYHLTAENKYQAKARKISDQIHIKKCKTNTKQKQEKHLIRFTSKNVTTLS